MALLGEFGCFAYYFNSVAWLAASGPSRFHQNPVTNVALLLVTSVLAVLVSKLLLKTIDLHFSQQTLSQERLLSQTSEQRETAFSLPFLLRNCLPEHFLGSVLYLLFLIAVLCALLRTCMFLALKYYVLAVDDDEQMDDLELKTWAVVVLFALSASLTAFSSYQSLQSLQIACVLLNIVYAVSNVTNETYIERRKAPSSRPIFHSFLGFLSIELIIPSVMAVSRVPSERHGVLLTWAVGLVAILYLALGALVQSDSQIYVNAPEWARELIALLCVFSSMHIHLGALTDVVIAWRYGLNVKVAQQLYPWRVQAVRVLLPFALYTFCFFFASCDFLLAKQRVNLVLGSMLTVSLALLIIPYCHSATLRRFTASDEEQKWWRRVLYVGGVAGAVASLNFFFFESDFFTITLNIDACIFGVLVLWQVAGVLHSLIQQT